MGYPNTPPDPPDYEWFHCACPYCGSEDEHDFIEDKWQPDHYAPQDELIDVKWRCTSCDGVFWWSESKT